MSPVTLFDSTTMSPSNPAFHPLALCVPPLAVGVIAATLGWIAARACPTLTVGHPARPWVAAILVAAGICCSLGGVISFRRARTIVNPLTPEAATTLVRSGVYRFTRNPMYLGFLLFLMADIVWLANAAAFVAAPAFVLYLNRFQILPEEHALRHRFGPTYLSYATQVRRWI